VTSETVRSPCLDYCILNIVTGGLVCDEYLHIRVFHGYASVYSFFGRHGLNQTVYRIVRVSHD